MAIHKAKDNSLKLILGEHALFVEFLNDFIDMDTFKGIQPADIEDITERFLPLFQDNKDSDTIKRININSDSCLFVIAIVEHESKVNHRASFKMLQYITLVLSEYEKEVNKINKNISFTKDFMFPPVLPIIFYDGAGSWTAKTNFLHKTELNDAFYKYIPKFEYELVNLNDYSISDLVKFGDTLSLIMIVDKIKMPDGINLLAALPQDYVEQLALNIPSHLNKLIADVITVLLNKINVPKDEIDVIVEKIYQRRYQEMFAFIEDYDVQKTRREAIETGRLEGRRQGELQGKLEGKMQGKLQGKLEGKLEAKLEDAINIIKELKATVTKAIEVTKLPDSERDNIIYELERQNVPYIN